MYVLLKGFYLFLRERDLRYQLVYREHPLQEYNNKQQTYLTFSEIVRLLP